MVNSQPGRPDRSPYIFPSSPGTYALVLHLSRPITPEIGSLGKHHLPAASYVYTGSAFGPGGLRARIERHLRIDKPRHWHIDFLRPRARVIAVYYSVTPTHFECAWSQALIALPSASIPIPRFGASDCKAGCPAHLVALPSDDDLAQVEALLGFPQCVNMQGWSASRAGTYRRTPAAKPRRESG